MSERMYKEIQLTAVGLIQVTEEEMKEILYKEGNHTPSMLVACGVALLSGDNRDTKDQEDG